MGMIGHNQIILILPFSISELGSQKLKYAVYLFSHDMHYGQMINTI